MQIHVQCAKETYTFTTTMARSQFDSSMHKMPNRTQVRSTWERAIKYETRLRPRGETLHKLPSELWEVKVENCLHWELLGFGGAFL